MIRNDLIHHMIFFYIIFISVLNQMHLEFFKYIADRIIIVVCIILCNNHIQTNAKPLFVVLNALDFELLVFGPGSKVKLLEHT